MARKRVEVEVPDGTRLGFAQDAEGGMRGLLFDEDTGRLVGHANLFESPEYEAHSDDDDDDDDDGGGGGNWGYGEPPPPQRDENVDLVVEVIAQVLTNLLIHGAERAAPHVKNWWSEKAVPSLKEKAVPAVKLAPGKVRSAVRRRGRTKAVDGGIASEAVEVNAAGAAASGERMPTVGSVGTLMSSAEAQQRLAQAVAAAAFAREQMSVLHNARIVDEDGGPALASLLNEITPQHLETAIRTVLEVSPLMLDRPSLSAFTISLGTGRPERDRVPLGGEEALPLAPGELDLPA